MKPVQINTFAHIFGNQIFVRMLNEVIAHYFHLSLVDRT